MWTIKILKIFFKIIKIITAYIIACLIISTFIVTTYYFSNINNITTEIIKIIFIKNILVLMIAIMFFSTIILVFSIPLAIIKKIKSVNFYIINSILSIFITLLFIPKYQGIENDENSLWVPFISFISATLAGYIFWFIVIKQKK